MKSDAKVDRIPSGAGRLAMTLNVPGCDARTIRMILICGWPAEYGNATVSRIVDNLSPETLHGAADVIQPLVQKRLSLSGSQAAMWRVEPTMSTASTVMMLRSAILAPPTDILAPRVLKPALKGNGSTKDKPWATARRGLEPRYPGAFPVFHDFPLFGNFERRS